jgi:hypothetical protein
VLYSEILERFDGIISGVDDSFLNLEQAYKQVVQDDTARE